MTDMREAVARALAKHDRIEICSDASYALSSYGPKADAALSLMQPEIDRRVAEEPNGLEKFMSNVTEADREAAKKFMQRNLLARPILSNQMEAVLRNAFAIHRIEAAKAERDRLQPKIEALEADNARLVKANGLRMKELHKERKEAKLWFERAQEWKARNEAMEADNAQLREVSQRVVDAYWGMVQTELAASAVGVELARQIATEGYGLHLRLAVKEVQQALLEASAAIHALIGEKDE